MPVCLVCRHRTPYVGQVCDGCRDWITTDLAALVKAWSTLSAEPGRGGTERISGTRDKPLGVKIPALDLMAAVTSVAAITDPHRDQVGQIPVAAILETWAREWARHLGHMLPALHVPLLARWLDLRLDWACNSYPAVDVYAREIKAALAACEAVMGGGGGDGTIAIGPCPTKLPAGEECRQSLRADPYMDNITCRRCQTVWPKRNWLWIHDRQTAPELDRSEVAC